MIDILTIPVGPSTCVEVLSGKGIVIPGMYSGTLVRPPSDLLRSETLESYYNRSYLPFLRSAGLDIDPFKRGFLGFSWSSSTIARGERSLASASVSFPHWLLAGTFAMYPLLWGWRRWLRPKRRRRQGLCVNCGYNLQGVTQRCPECGTPFDPHKQECHIDRIHLEGQSHNKSGWLVRIVTVATRHSTLLLLLFMILIALVALLMSRLL